MGALIFGILFTAFFITLTVIGIKRDWEMTIIYFLLSIASIVLTLNFALKTNTNENDCIDYQKYTTRLVPVNGYYLYNGQYVLSNNERYTEGEMTIAVNDLSPKTVLYQKEEITTYGGNFWHFGGKETKKSILFSKE